MGRPFSQHEVPPPVPLAGVIPGVFEACDRAPGLRAPVCAPEAEPPGLNDGAFATPTLLPAPPGIGECAPPTVVV